MCLIGKIRLLHKLCLGVSYNTVGQEFNANESIMLNKVALTETHIKHR